jgi:hypothetical protein
MNWLRLRNNQLKFQTPEKKLPIVFEECVYGMNLDSIENIDQKITMCNWLDLDTLGFWPVVLNNFPRHWTKLYVVSYGITHLRCVGVMWCIFNLRQLRRVGFRV